MIYFFVLMAVFAILEIYLKNDKTKNILFFIMMSVLTFFACFRNYTVGTDTGMYWTDYTSILNTPFNQLGNFRYEIGFCIMCKILGFISTNPQTIIIFTSLLINIVVTYFIYKNAKNKLSCGIFYFTLNYYFGFLCLMRQALAICFILIAYNFLRKNKLVHFIIFILIASTFHMSALVFIILPILKRIPMNKFLPIFVIIISLFVFLMTKPAFYLLASIIGDYSKYLTSDFIKPSYISAGLYSLTSFLFFLFGFLASKKYINPSNNKKGSTHQMLGMILALGTIISVASMRISIINRIYFYFGFFAILWLSNNLELIKQEKAKLFCKIILYICTFCYVLVITLLGWYGIFPYSFY